MRSLAACLVLSAVLCLFSLHAAVGFLDYVAPLPPEEEKRAADHAAAEYALETSALDAALAALEEPPVAPIPADGDSVLERKRNAMAAPRPSPAQPRRRSGWREEEDEEDDGPEPAVQPGRRRKTQVPASPPAATPPERPRVPAAPPAPEPDEEQLDVAEQELGGEVVPANGWAGTPLSEPKVQGACPCQVRGKCGRHVGDCPPPYGVNVNAKSSGTVAKAERGGNVASKCNRGALASSRITVADRVTVSVASTMSIGNAMSPYWQARGLAAVANLPFSTSGFSVSFMKHLPKAWNPPSPADGPFLEKLGFACSSRACSGQDWEYSHNCVGAWTEIREMIRDDTHKALKAFGLEKLKQDFLENEVVMHLRCTHEVFLKNDQYGPPAFSLFDAIPAKTPRVTFIEGKPGKDRYCYKIRKAIMAYIKKRHPHMQFREELGDSGNVADDFARLVYAPILIRGMGSFSLWAALANRNLVISPRNPTVGKDTWRWKDADLGQDWVWSNAPVLTMTYGRENLKMNATCPKLSVMRKEPQCKEYVIEWLASH